MFWRKKKKSISLDLKDFIIRNYNVYPPNQSSFCIVRRRRSSLNVRNWKHCREFFARVFNKKTEYIGYCSSASTSQNLINIIDQAENKLNLKEKTEFRITNGLYSLRKDLIIMKVPKWWRRNALRRQMYTILIRAGEYGYTPYDLALQNYKYSYLTLKAVEKFFNGYTCLLFPMWEMGSGGWVNTFRKNNNLWRMYKPWKK